ncbi:MAG: hypothetical protein AAGD43_18015 [Pseudomonadota bacterium]
MFERYGMKRTGQAIGALAVVVMVADVYLSASFGYSINLISTLIYGAISAASGLLLVVAATFYRQSSGWNFERYIAAFLLAAWFPAFGFNVWSNMGVATAGRMAEVQKASLTQEAFNEKKGNLAEAKANLVTFKKVLDEQNADFRKLTTVKVGDWTATAVPASTATLSELIEDKEKARLREKGRGGCGPICEQRADEKDMLVRLHGLAAKIEKTHKQIAATERVLASARDTVENANAGISNTTNQVGIHAKLIRYFRGDDKVWAADLESDDLVAANEGMGIFSAFILALVAAVLLFALAWPKIKKVRPTSDLDDMERPPAPSDKSWFQTSTMPEGPDLQPAAQLSRVPVPNNDLKVNPTTVGEMNLDRIKDLLKTHRVVAA